MLVAPLLILLWSFVVGACVGSFLNVVAWRLPLGMSLSWPSSHCPGCRTPILLRDNVPVFGWLWLRGRCRKCRTRISARYPTVEFLTGATFAVLAWCELVQDGMNLPLPAAMDEYLPLDALLRIWIYHAILASLLVALSLFEWDGARPPRRFTITGLVLAVVPPLVWPELSIVPFAQAATLDSTMRIATPVIGIAAGAILGLVLAWSMFGKGFRENLSVVVALSLVGGFLGWQAALTIAGATALVLIMLTMLQQVTKQRVARPTLLASLVAIGLIVCWRHVTELRFPSSASDDRRNASLVACFIISIFCLAALRRLAPAGAAD